MGHCQPGQPGQPGTARNGCQFEIKLRPSPKLGPEHMFQPSTPLCFGPPHFLQAPRPQSPKAPKPQGPQGTVPGTKSASATPAPATVRRKAAAAEEVFRPPRLLPRPQPLGFSGDSGGFCKDGSSHLWSFEKRYLFGGYWDFDTRYWDFDTHNR